MSRSEKQLERFAGVGARVGYSPVEAAAATGRSRSRIFKAIKDKELAAQKDGRATIITDAELRRWVGAMPTIGRKTEAHADV